MNKDQFFAALAASLNHKDNRPTISDVVEIDDGFVIVRVTVDMPTGSNAVNLPSYFAKELVKSIPALDSIEASPAQVNAVMKISTVDANGDPSNTADDISVLRDMAGAIINLVITNSEIPKKIQAIADDCACWTFGDKSHGEDSQESK